MFREAQADQRGKKKHVREDVLLYLTSASHGISDSFFTLQAGK
jgi:hypothetical protein